MYTSYNSCGSSSQDGHFIFDSSTFHTFHPRELTTVSASSFIIVVTVGFMGLLMLCAGSSAYYRRRLARNLALPGSQHGSNNGQAVRPQLWDVSIGKWEGQESGHGDWSNMQPLAIRVLVDHATPDGGDGPLVQGRRRNRRRCGCRWATNPRRVQPLPEKSSVPEISRDADVVVLVAMPDSPSTPHSPDSAEHEVVGSNACQTDDHPWSRYVVGVAQIPLYDEGKSMVI